jgi:hypothetical protein
MSVEITSAKLSLIPRINSEKHLVLSTMANLAPDRWTQLMTAFNTFWSSTAFLYGLSLGVGTITQATLLASSVFCYAMIWSDTASQAYWKAKEDRLR